MKIYGDPEVPFLAQDWHGGQWSPLYQLVSSGWPQELDDVKSALREAQKASNEIKRSHYSNKKEWEEASESITTLIDGLQESIRRKSKKEW